ncbi:hypothetical protein [Alteromonas antoniana]|uniref:hypothetical protein n=1 Tax=Alteromonas antoniana TaxID=2803813 RepID=UPI001C448A4B|nr:hypothetical protein [Alteromonas antoniana]
MAQKLKLYLHIGWPRSGSTSIQTAFYNKREELLLHGILYPKSGLQHVGHHQWAYPLLSSPVDWIKPASITALLQELKEEVSHCDSNVDSVFLSSEAFIYCNNYENLRNAFTDFDIEIIAIVREQLSLINSAYLRQLSTNATKLSPENYVSEFIDKPDYFFEKKLSPVLSDRQHVKLNAFPFSSVKNQFWHRISDIIGVPKDIFARVCQPATNVSLPRKAIELLQSWPENVRLLGPGFEQFRQLLLNEFGSAQPGSTMLTEELCNIIVDRYKADRIWVRENLDIKLSPPSLKLDSEGLQISDTLRIIRRLV